MKEAFSLPTRGELRDGNRWFPIFMKDEVVTGRPPNSILEYECPAFIVYRKSMSIQRYYVIRERAEKKLVRLFQNLLYKKIMA